MKLELTGRIHSYEGIKPTKKGFSQQVVLHQPELKDDGQLIRKEQFYPLSIWSNNQTDSRFVDSKLIKSKVKVTCYLNGEKYSPEGKPDIYYNLKLNVAKIETV